MKIKTMRQKKLILCIGFLIGIGLQGLKAQQTIIPAGGDATGSGGSMSLSIGQTFVDFQSNGNDDSVNQGVQQSIELLSLGLKDDLILVTSAIIFPNPTANKIQLQLQLEDKNKLSYQLYDINGKLLQSEEILEFTTEVQLSQFPNSVYFLKIIRNNNLLKTFKILKN
tara:strand:- start:2759 stop:3262 length:504 start_codon:yes stop_codon:yes gene_type:complete